MHVKEIKQMDQRETMPFQFTFYVHKLRCSIFLIIQMIEFTNVNPLKGYTCEIKCGPLSRGKPVRIHLSIFFSRNRAGHPLTPMGD